MRRQAIPFVVVVGVLLCAALAAIAAPKGSKEGRVSAAAARKGAKKKAAKDTKDEGEAGDEGGARDDKSATDSEETDESEGDSEKEAGDDLGAPPPARSAERKQGKRSSPLNPKPREFPSRKRLPPLSDYDKLLGDIATLRGRVSALTTTLFASKLRVIVHTGGSDLSRLAGLRVLLDDGAVFIAKKGFSARDDRVIYEHSLAPGQHVLGVELERLDSRNGQFRSLQSNRMTVLVPEKKTLEVRIDLVDYSDMAGFRTDQYGHYDLRTRLDAEVKEQ